jgi:hypothetical protein
MVSEALLRHMRRHGVLRSQVRTRSALAQPIVSTIDHHNVNPGGASGFFRPWGPALKMSPRERRKEMADFVHARTVVAKSIEKKQNAVRFNVRPPRAIKPRLMSEKMLQRLGFKIQPVTSMRNPFWDSQGTDARRALKAQEDKQSRGYGILHQ